MPTLTQAQVYALARGAGLGMLPAAVATAVAQAESGLRTDAPGDQALAGQVAPNGQHWGPSFGLWQIRSIQEENGKGTTRDASRLTDPAFNARSMAQISGMGQNFGAWTTFTNGAYKNFLGSAKTAGASQETSHSGPWSLAPGGDAVAQTTAAANSALSGLSGWAKDALPLGLKILGAGTAAALFVLGAVHTVSEKG
jgi:hypothetical protein